MFRIDGAMPMKQIIGRVLVRVHDVLKQSQPAKFSETKLCTVISGAFIFSSRDKMMLAPTR